MRIVARRFSLHTISLLGIAALSLSVYSGCAVGLAAAGAGGTVAYVKGDIEQTFPYPIDLVWDAGLEAMAESEVPVTASGKDQLTAQIEGRTATGDKIKIVMAAQGSVTTLKIRVNTFGNKQISVALLSQIDRRLSTFAEPMSAGPPTQAPSHGAVTMRPSMNVPPPYSPTSYPAPPQSIGQNQSYARLNAARTASWPPPDQAYR
jgi:hypothetical protein